jgi:23S rRNA (adenine2503-C2)-methyltransferase
MTDPELRARLLPKAPRTDPSELVALGEDYARTTGYPIQYQWTLLEGVNDGEAEICGLWYEFLDELNTCPFL